MMLLLYFENYFSFTVLQLCGGQICISTKVKNSRFQLACKVKHLELEVYITDPLGIQQSRCLIPYPKPSCDASYGDVVQNLSSNITVLTLGEDLKKYQQLNGKWSCLHGTNNERANIDVSIQGTKGTLLFKRLAFKKIKTWFVKAYINKFYQLTN